MSGVRIPDGSPNNGDGFYRLRFFFAEEKAGIRTRKGLSEAGGAGGTPGREEGAPSDTAVGGGQALPRSGKIPDGSPNNGVGFYRLRFLFFIRLWHFLVLPLISLF